MVVKKIIWCKVGLVPVSLHEENLDVSLLLEVVYSVLDTHVLARFLQVQMLIRYMV